MYPEDVIFWLENAVEFYNDLHSAPENEGDEK